MFALRTLSLRPVCSVGPSRARLFSGRHGMEDREDALEKKAVAEHDKELLTKLRKSADASGEVVGLKNVTVIGAGLMGAGIAQVAANSGFQVTLMDGNGGALKKALLSIESSVSRVAKKAGGDASVPAAVKKVMSNLTTSESLAGSVKSADLVIEAIVENLPAKKQLFLELSKAAPNWAILATNTSSLSVSEIAANVPDKSRVGGLHFFNPVPVMQLVEVVVTPQTSEKTYKGLTHFVDKIGKKAVVCQNTPGFIVNRLLVPYMGEAIRMVERRDASLTDVDAGMQLGAGHPMGPFALADYVGLDTTLSILTGWEAQHPQVQVFKVPALLKAIVAAGFTGQKGKGGFYVAGAPNPNFFDEHGRLKAKI